MSRKKEAARNGRLFRRPDPLGSPAVPVPGPVSCLFPVLFARLVPGARAFPNLFLAGLTGRAPGAGLRLALLLRLLLFSLLLASQLCLFRGGRLRRSLLPGGARALVPDAVTGRFGGGRTGLAF